LSELAQHYVGGLEVAVENAPVVGVGDRVAHLHEDREQAMERPGRLDLGITAAQAGEDVGERAALDLAHDEVDEPFRGHTHLVDGDHVGVSELRGHLGFDHKTRELRRLDALRIDQGLHRNGAPQVGVPRSEDETHAPAAQLALDLETTQGRGRGRVRIGE
jgi:hypothetical protein